MPEYALEAALEIREDTVTTTLKSCGSMSTSSGQGCRGGALRQGWAGLRLRQGDGEEVEAVVVAAAFATEQGCRALADSGSGTIAWAPAMALSLPGSFGSHGGKWASAPALAQEEEVAISVWRGVLSCPCTCGISLPKDGATPIEMCTRGGAPGP